MLENQNVRLVIVFIIGLLVGLGVYWTWDNRYAAPSDVNEEQNETTDEEISLTGPNAVAVEDLQEAGNKVVIAKAKFASPGWVAVHDDVGGVPGRILGAKLFDRGEVSGEVELLRNTVPGTSYLIVLHSDDGDYKNFSAKTDTILTNEDGDMVMIRFTTNGEAPQAVVPIDLTK